LKFRVFFSAILCQSPPGSTGRTPGAAPFQFEISNSQFSIFFLFASGEDCKLKIEKCKLQIERGRRLPSTR
jgi:hypothetical protein